MSDEVQKYLISGFFATLLTVIGWIINRNAARAAAKAEEVKIDLSKSTRATAEKLESIAIVGEKTHTLVNSNMAAQLKISAVALRRLAENTSHPDDIAAAELSEKLLEEHEVKQASVDAKEKQ